MQVQEEKILLQILTNLTVKPEIDYPLVIVYRLGL